MSLILDSPTNIITANKSRTKMAWHVACMREIKFAHKLSEDLMEKVTRARRRCRWEHNIKRDSKDEDVEVYTGLIWLRIGSSHSFQWNFSLHKMLPTISLAKTYSESNTLAPCMYTNPPYLSTVVHLWTILNQYNETNTNKILVQTEECHVAWPVEQIGKTDERICCFQVQDKNGSNERHALDISHIRTVTDISTQQAMQHVIVGPTL